MSSLKPVVSLEDLNTEEKKQLSAITLGEIKKGVLLYVLPCVIFTTAAVYVNLNWLAWKLDSGMTREVLNLVLVVGSILPARLFVNKIIQHTKAGNAWKKKVIRGKIHGMDKKTLFISTQKVDVPSSVAAQFKVDDEVEIALSTINNIVIYAIKK